MPGTRGREWFDRFLNAFHERDLATIWALQTKASHALILLRMQETIDRANADPEYNRILKERMGPDITALAPKAVWDAYTMASCEHVGAGHMSWRYLGEEEDGEAVLLRMQPAAGSRPLPAGMTGEIVQVLVEEDGELRLDKPETEARAEA